MFPSDADLCGWFHVCRDMGFHDPRRRVQSTLDQCKDTKWIPMDPSHHVLPRRKEHEGISRALTTGFPLLREPKFGALSDLEPLVTCSGLPGSNQLSDPHET